MAKTDANLRQISVNGGSLTVTLGAAHATIPGAQLDSFIRALEAARLMLSVDMGAPEPAPAPVEVARPPRAEVSNKGYTTYEPRVEAAPAPIKRRVGRPKGSGAGLAQARRSRKRVGDALADWLKENPGWHSEAELLGVVSDNRMTDASPKRALKIALGKQKDSVFVTDGSGNWKLVGDPSPTQPAVPKERKKPGRKPGSGTKAKAKSKAKGRPKMTATVKATRGPAATKAKGKGKGRGRGGRAPKGSASDSEGSSVPETTAVPAAVGRLVRVKKGQDRREALLTPAELEARKQAATSVDAVHFRWDLASRAERERMRRNLFGDAIAVGKVN